MPNPVVHFEIQSSQAPELQKYYADLFGWHLSVHDELSYGLIDTKSGRGIGGGISPADGPSRVTFYVEVDDLQAYLDKAERLGGKTIVPPTVLPNVVTFALFADPDGNVVGIVLSD